MEQVSENPSFSPHIKKVLKNYRAASMNSLSGPDTFMAVRAAAKGGVGLLGLAVEMELKKSLGSGKSGKLDDENCTTYAAPSSGGHLAKKKMFAVATMESSSAAARSPTPNNSANNNESVCSSTNKGKLSSSTAAAIAAEGETTSKGGSDYDPFLTPPPFPIQQIPILTASDQSRSERSETLLEGEVIQGFMVGGEKRLCLPQILNSVLRDFSLQQINQVCDELQIFCSRCNHDQLQVLKFITILPVTAPSCGLITKTDAERLCNALLHSHPPRAVHDVPPDSRPFHFTIYHECFGKCQGIYTPEYYSSALARCIECAECHGLFCPQKFVGHAHKALENRTCHWGFDSANWRYYILAAKDQGEGGVVAEQLQSHLAEMKNRFDPAAASKSGAGNHKRKPHIESLEEKGGGKKSKLEEATYYPYVYDPMMTYLYGVPSLSRVSAFRPWSPMVGKDGKLALPTQPSSFGRDSSSQPLPPYLSHEPPVLLNPERVVSVAEMERFERHYQPNVALAPPSAQMQAQQKSATTGHVNSSAAYANVERREAVKSSRSTAEAAALCTTEMEVSTDTEEIFSDTTTCSSLGSPSHNSPKLNSEVAGTSSGDVITSSFVKELKSLRDLMSEEQIDKKTRAKLMEKVLNLVKNCEEQLESSLLSKTELLKELEYLRISKKERLREASEARHMLRKEVEKLYEEKIQREREMEELRKEASSLRHHHDDRDDDCSGSSEVKRANHHLRRKVDIMGEELQKLQDELSHLRRQQRACSSGGLSQGHRSGERGGGSSAVQKDVASSPISLIEHTKIKKEKDFESSSFDD